jgi:DNA-binding response OmpR family regulator
MAQSLKPSHFNIVLIVEDEPPIAMDMEIVLQDEGLSVGRCASREDAMRWLVSMTPTAAILDFHLKDGEATDVASNYKNEGTRIFCSGLDQDDIPLALQEATWLFKPFDDRQSVALVTEVLQMRSNVKWRNEHDGGRKLETVTA